jgi:hypothetical protein
MTPRTAQEVHPAATADDMQDPAETPESLRDGIDGLPLLAIGRSVTNAEVLDANHQERAGR